MHMEKLDSANAHWMKPFSAGCDFPPITTQAFTASTITSCSPVHSYISMLEEIVNTNHHNLIEGFFVFHLVPVSL